MHFFCVAVFVMFFPTPEVKSHSATVKGACPKPKVQEELARSVQAATGARYVEFSFEQIEIQTEPGKDA